jgi:hypothetical protein
MIDELEPVELPAVKPVRLWAYLFGVLVCRILNALYWAFAGGLGWGFGSAIGSFFPWPAATALGGAIGLALALLGILTVSLEKKQFEYPPITLGMFGGIAVGIASLLILHPFGRESNLVLGAGAGFLVGIFTVIIKKYFSPLNFVPACLIAITGSALFTEIGFWIGGHLGWAAAGAISLFAMAMIGICWPRQPAVEVDANGQIVRFVPRGEMFVHTIKQSWSFAYPVAWGWDGLFAGLIASLWAAWAADDLNRDEVRQPFLWCGGLAAFVIIATRLGIEVDEKRNNANEPTG